MSRCPKPQPAKPALLLPSQRAKRADATLPFSTTHALPPARCDRLPLGPGVRLVAWHPCGLYVLDKPEGILSHPNKKSEIGRSLLLAPYSLAHEYYDNLHARNEPPVDRKLPAALQSPPTDSDSATAENRHAAANEASIDPADISATAIDANANPTDASATGADSNTTPFPERLYLLHRLDSATSGLLLLADNEALANSVRTAFAEGGVRKTYFALCAAATPVRPGQKGRWSDRLQREHSGAGGAIVHVRASNSGLSAVTDFICRKTTPHSHSLALLELHPISGRTHQLRVHCAQHGLPILGDGKYGDFRLNREIAKASGHKRLFLHAAALELNFTHEGTALRLRFEAPLPSEFDALLNNAPELKRPAPRTGGSTSSRPQTATRGTPPKRGGAPQTMKHKQPVKRKRPGRNG